MITGTIVRAQRFSYSSKWHEAYNIDEVDRFLEDLADRLDRREPVDAQWVRDFTFQTVRFVKGYDIDEVDDFLSRVERELSYGDTTSTSADLSALSTEELDQRIADYTAELKRRGLS